ncbi:hypothetical protein CJD36_005340 [Flavipsychrobacter stenotrophus]|uniref:Uncharacterized protein n=1 Tax=Flavipsychrobacter stenotrophus TaxID=2077091 RepID=A0A2S7SX87_9BACT|nr:hypothetical protein [Flavipsychrobacter stenotrophus]PQJ11231.1 hypothetical protein CJD36_005340 [Flavipsychrobacter stenotrophus]
MKIITFVVSLLFVSFNSSGQVFTTSKTALVNEVLSDTGMGYGYYIGLKVKSPSDDTIKLMVTQSQFLFYYFQSTKSWTGKHFIEEMKQYLLTNRVLTLEDGYLKTKLLHRIDQCGYGTWKTDSLVHFFNSLSHKERRENQCLIYELFTRKFVTGQAETRTEICKPLDIGKMSDY